MSSETTSDARLPQETEQPSRLERTLAVLRSDRMGMAGLVIFTALLFIAIFAPVLAPYDPTATNYAAVFQAPSSQHLLGTDASGRDIFSRLLYGTRPAFYVGLSSAFVVAIIGTAVGVVSGYYGGLVDEVLMRTVDFLYGVPFLPFVIMLVTLWEPSIFTLLIALWLLLWRGTARVVRSHTLTLKEKPFIKSAKAAGASDFRILVKHITPNVLPLSFLYGSFAIGWAILTEANISFLGFGDPTLISWGQMLLEAKLRHALIRDAWWWIIAPGFMIMITIVSVFAIARGYEEELDPTLEDR